MVTSAPPAATGAAAPRSGLAAAVHDDDERHGDHGDQRDAGEQQVQAGPAAAAPGELRALLGAHSLARTACCCAIRRSPLLRFCDLLDTAASRPVRSQRKSTVFTTIGTCGRRSNRSRPGAGGRPLRPRDTVAHVTHRDRLHTSSPGSTASRRRGRPPARRRPGQRRARSGPAAPTGASSATTSSTSSTTSSTSSASYSWSWASRSTPSRSCS